MNLLNPLALIGLVAAGIPVLLHLLNLRRLRTVEFSTLRFLHELQQTRVRRLKVQQILLLILRTLLVIFAVLAVARPTIETRLPLLSSAERTSVVLLIDNSASMQGADQNGRRLRQAQDAAQEVLSRLTDGDEVCVIPMAGRDAYRMYGFTRTFSEAAEEVERIAITEDRADVAGTLRLTNELLLDAAHAYREIFVISDGQRSVLQRPDQDTGRVLDASANVFLVRVGNGLQGLEQNLSVDSIRVLTTLFQPQRPIEIEAVVRNGSDRDATGVAVSMAYNGTRVAQRAVDVPAGESRTVVLAAPPQRRGMLSASIELDQDAIDGDNRRYAGIVVPPPSRIAVVGASVGADLAALALDLGTSAEEQGTVFRFATAAELLPSISSLDVVVLADGALSASQSDVLKQFVERGGGLAVFASEQPDHQELLSAAGLNVGEIRTASRGRLGIRSIDHAHPLYRGVFQRTGSAPVVESPELTRARPVSGGVEIVSTDVGALVSEGTIGSGRVLYLAAGVDGTWGPLAGTGFFAATMVRASLYLAMPRDQGIPARIGETITAPIPGRMSGEAAFRVTDVDGIASTATPVRLPSATLLTIPAQRGAGVVTVTTTDSAAVMTVAVNPPVEESRLSYLSDSEWLTGVRTMVADPDRVVATATGRQLAEAVQVARVGSELWPLFIVLAVLCAIAESVVSRLMARDETAAPSP